MRGFTLIELLIVITIIGVLTTLLLPELGRFNRYQALESAASQLQSDLRVAQSNASSGVLCGTGGQRATEWQLVIVEGGAGYQTQAICADGTDGSSKTYNFSAGVVVGAIAGCYKGSVSFSNITSNINYGAFGCAEDNKLIIPLKKETSLLNLIVEKGGAIYVSSE